jgi:hypothetical protein
VPAVRLATISVRCVGADAMCPSLRVGWHGQPSQALARRSTAHQRRRDLADAAPAPERLDTAEIHDDPDRTTDLVFSYPVSQTSVDGLTGAPSHASAADGAALFELIAAALSEHVERARAEDPPSLT